MFSNKRLRYVVAGSVAAVSLALAAGAANAAPPLSGSGTLTYQGGIFNGMRQAGGNTIIDLSATVVYTGMFTGTSTLSGTLTFHPNGTSNFHDVETFTGTVNGVPGTATFVLDGQGQGPIVSASAAIVSATGGLAGLHGVIHENAVVLDPLIGPVGTYETQVGFDNA
jgi:Protein of unknown function (DUF3224)